MYVKTSPVAGMRVSTKTYVIWRASSNETMMMYPIFDSSLRAIARWMTPTTTKPKPQKGRKSMVIPMGNSIMKGLAEYDTNDQIGARRRNTSPPSSSCSMIKYGVTRVKIKVSNDNLLGAFRLTTKSPVLLGFFG